MGNPVFSKFSIPKFTRLLYIFKSETIYKNQYLIREGQEIDKVYIIKEGEFEVFKKRNCSNLERIEESINRQKKGCWGNQFLETGQISVFKLAKGNIIGDVDAFYHRKSEASYQCISASAEVYAGNSQDFFAYMQKDSFLWAIYE